MFHILNGDALLQQFPESMSGERIVCREALVDGPVLVESMEEFIEVRARFVTEAFQASHQEYSEKVVPEFKKMQAIPQGTEINLWFEDDLFCQVNFWFVVHLLHSSANTGSVFLIRPEQHTPYGFGSYDSNGLAALFQQRMPLTHAEMLARLWESYQQGNTHELLNLAQKLESTYPFILPAVQAHIQRIPTENYEGRPKESLRSIMRELNTQEFGPVFHEFCKREAIYGFGDLQVKRLFDELIAENIRNSP